MMFSHLFKHKTKGAADFRRLFRLAKPYKGRLAIAALCLLVGSLTHLAFPYVLRILIDSAFIERDARQLNLMILSLVVVMVVGAAFDFVKSFQIAYVGERVVTDLRESLYAHLQKLSVSYYDEHRTGEMMSHITNDAAVLQGALSNNLIIVPQYFITLTVGAAMIVATDWRLALYLGGVVPALAIISSLFGWPLRWLARDVQEELSKGITVVEETLAAQRIVKAFAREDYETARFRDAIERFFQLCVRRAVVQSAFGTTIWLCISLSLAGLFWYGGHEVMAGRLTPGGLISFIIYLSLLINPVSGLARLYTEYQQALGASDRVFALLDTKPAIADWPGAYELPPIEGRIDIRNMTFSYTVNGAANGDESAAVLKNINLKIEPGKTLAIVGPSGAGKTSLASVILRFYEPQSGAINIDGHDITGVTQKSLRNAIGIVPQDPILFSGSIRDNIAYGKLDATPEEIEAAATAANAHDFICRLDRGYDSVVGERGVKLSGGQRQRVAIARALLRNPRILILDEATSSLDNESERAVQQALERLMEGRTTLIIAHRLTTIERADRIVVLDKGEIIDYGAHEELLARGGLYYRLYTKNFAEEAGLAAPA